MSYEEIYIENIRVMREFLELYWNKSAQKDPQKAFQMLYSIYRDPDCAEVKTIHGIECTADGLISLRRLYHHEGLSDQLVQNYEAYRKGPIVFFPREKNGINTVRNTVFGDRIDFTLFDIKRYLESTSEADKNLCRLASAYRRPITKRWLKEMGSFRSIVDWLGIKGIFTNENYEVFDIEKGNGSVIREYLDEYHWMWSDNYYNSLKEKIKQFMRQHEESAAEKVSSNEKETPQS